MEAERKRLMPKECVDLHNKMPSTMIVKMIEESFNEPFKTGPLIDQQGHYAIFDILMNRQMFEYISEHHLYTKDGQRVPPISASWSTFRQVRITGATLGAFMLKVSWKILSPKRSQRKKFPHGRRRWS